MEINRESEHHFFLSISHPFTRFPIGLSLLLGVKEAGVDIGKG